MYNDDMINAQDVLEKISQTKRMVAKEMLARNWQVEGYDSSMSLMRVTRADGAVFDIHGAAPPTTSLVAALKADNKLATQRAYEAHGLSVLETFTYDGDHAKKLLDTGEKLVIKPVDSAHGNGITIGIDTEQELEKAAELAKKFSDGVIAQVYTSNQIDIRAICIDYKFQAALIRYPATVVGDGSTSIEALIEQENTSKKRGHNYQKELNVIDVERAKSYLGDAFSDVPAEGEQVQVIGTANVGSGGTTKDVTAQMPEWFTNLAEKAAKVSLLPVAGVDFLIKTEPETTSTREQINPYIIEINANPALFLHETPTDGQSQPVIRTYVDYLKRLQIED